MMQTQTRQPQRGLNFDDVWAMFQETDKKFQETDKKFQESRAEHDRMMAETDKKFQENAALIKAMSQEADKRQKEADKKFLESKAEHDRMIEEMRAGQTELSKNIGGLGNDIGDFAEGLLTSDLLKKFVEYKLDFDTTLRNVEINEHGTGRPIAEVDWLLLNTTIALVGEAKAHLTQGDVDKHIMRIKKLSRAQNGLLGGKKLYGAVAGVKMTRTTSNYAKKRGFFVLEPAGDSVKVEAPTGKPAVW